MPKWREFRYADGSGGITDGKRYFVWENGRWVRAISPKQFLQLQKRLARLRATDPGGDIRL